MTRAKYLILLFFLLPSLAQAAVSISEVAWMGSTVSANHEWIELHNDAAAVDATGWTISDGMNLEIVLEGTLPAGYSVLERTSDESAPGSAWQIYTGALVNTGATLQLRKADGSLVDQVAGGENWESIGGDNVTKDTAQYTSAGWVTALATPGAAPVPNAAPTQSAAATESEKATKQASSLLKRRSDSSEPVRLELPDVTLQLAITAQAVGYVNQAIAFSVEPRGIGDTLTDSLQYEWNFGNGFGESGKEVTHAFLYPGTYVVTVYGAYKRQEQVARHEITILPVTTSLTLNRAGDVQVHNESPYEIDISGYVVRGAKSFTFPARSVLLPNQTITLPQREVGDTTSKLVALYDATKAMVAMRAPQELQSVSATRLTRADVPAQTPTPRVSSISYQGVEDVSTAVPAPPASAHFSFASTDTATTATPQTDAAVVLAATSSQLAGAAVAPPASTPNRSYILLTVLLLAVIAGIYLAPVRNDLA